MIISVTRIVEQIRLLDVEKVYRFINESNKNRIKLISVDSELGPVRLERILENGEATSVTVSERNLAILADRIKENEPFSIDEIVKSSGNWRSAFESILAHAPEFCFCNINGRKHLVWCPQTPHSVGKITELDYALLPKASDDINNSDTLLEEFKYFIENCTKSPDSFRHYSSGLNTVTDYIKKFNADFISMLNYTDDQYLQAIYDKLMKVDDFVNKDNSPQIKKMYSNAFKSYLLFLRARRYFSKNRIKKEIRVSETYISNNYRPYITAIHTKPFILLAGISGTGKSRIIRELARACDTIDESPWEEQTPTNFCMISVKPNWHDSTDMLGYVSRISGKDVFVSTGFLEFLVKAWKYQNVPFFVCLDEMNLAPVEQYFAEYLSCIESRKVRNGKIVTDAIFPKSDEQWYIDFIHEVAGEGEKEFLSDGISIPQNLIVMGTVNMDETTFTFSRKVLDRAMTIEMNDVDLWGGLDETTGTFLLDEKQLIGSAVEGKDIYSDNKADCDIILQYLEKVNDALANTPFQIAYRTRNEFLLYVIENLKYQDEYSKEFCIARALDEITSMKILSRIEGDDSRLRLSNGESRLKHLQRVIKDALGSILGENDLDDKSETLNICQKKLEEMEQKLQNGYCSFWT